MKQNILKIALIHLLGEQITIDEFPNPDTFLRITIKIPTHLNFDSIQHRINQFILAFNQLTTEIPFPNQKSDMTGYTLKFTNEDNHYTFIFEPQIES